MLIIVRNPIEIHSWMTTNIQNGKRSWRMVSGVVEDHLMCVCKVVVLSWTFSTHDDTIDPVNLSMQESASAATGVRWG